MDTHPDPPTPHMRYRPNPPRGHSPPPTQTPNKEDKQSGRLPPLHRIKIIDARRISIVGITGFPFTNTYGDGLLVGNWVFFYQGVLRAKRAHRRPGVEVVMGVLRLSRFRVGDFASLFAH